MGGCRVDAATNSGFTAADRAYWARDKIAKRTYIRATASPSPLFDGYFEKLKSDPGWHTYAVPSGHDVMIDMPDRLSEILLEVG